MKQNFKKFLLKQAMEHPTMEPQDVYKQIFQVVFGAEHLLTDKNAAYTYLQKEYEELIPEEGWLCEQIGENVFRINLRVWKQRKIPLQWLFGLFVGSVEIHGKQSGKAQESRKEAFRQCVEDAKTLVKEGAFAFSEEDFLQYVEEYEKTGIKAVHHSEGYRAAERPAYRVVSSEYVRLLPILETVAALMAQRANQIQEPIVVAIDGRCASGKSTMAKMLSEIMEVGIVHMDDFYLPMELRTEERFSQPGGNVHYERFCKEVLPRLKKGEAFSYQRFDCSKMQLGENREVKGADVYVVEGAYSFHPMLGDYAAVKVFSDIEPGEQIRRIEERDGSAVLSKFRERWIPLEEAYFAAYDVKQAADRIV